MPAISASGGWGPGCQVPAHLAPGLPAFAQGLEGLGLGECSGLGFPCRARDGRHGGHTPREPSPVHKAEVLLQEAGVHGALAEFQPRLRVVVHVVDAHLLQDPKAPLRGGGDGRQHWHISIAPRRCCPASPCGRCAHARTRAPAHHTRPDGALSGQRPCPPGVLSLCRRDRQQGSQPAVSSGSDASPASSALFHLCRSQEAGVAGLAPWGRGAPHAPGLSPARAPALTHVSGRGSPARAAIKITRVVR